MLWSQSFWACPEPWGKEEIAACIWFWLKYVGGVVVLGERGSARSGEAWECFCWRISRDSLLELTKELSPDSICKAPLMLKSDSFWFTFSYLWLGPCGHCSVVRLRVWERLQASGGCQIPGMCWFLTLWNSWLFKEIPLGSGPDDRMEKGKHSRRCQSSSAFEDMAFIDEFAQSWGKRGACSLGDAVDGVVAGSQGLDESIEGGGIKWVGVRGWGSWRMWWVNYGVTGAAKPTREWVSLIFRHFYAWKMKGPVTLVKLQGILLQVMCTVVFILLKQ